MSSLLARGLRRTPLLRSTVRLPPNRFVHVRSVSVFSGVAKLAGRTAGRGVVGLGVGAGALTYADWKIDGFKTGAAGFLSEFSETLGSSFDALATTTNETLSSISTVASETFSSATLSASEKLASATAAASETWAGFRSKLSDAFPRQAEDDGHGPRGEEAGGDGYEEGEGGPSGGQSAAAAAVLAASGLSVNSDGSSPTQDLLLLTKKLIEIRSILLSLGDDSNLTLPSIVVIGSQSSGKSSVLEAIVGREFLPKGDNMVTRRPLELTLVHTPASPSNPNPKTYAEIEGRPGQLSDFSLVQAELKNLNEAVSTAECVSDEPIHLRISSPDVPDLSLVDLPGYVQISSMDQPEELKSKIAGLCDKYIRTPNIILAVCAANVDLANSPALRASKKVDPLGIRTIGVVTKMDLVPPEVGAEILANQRYPLALGYVGVVSKTPATPPSRLLIKSRADDEHPGAVARAHESEYFSDNGRHFSREGILVGTDNLKGRLMRVLEESMASSLHSISNAVALDLEETSYQFKVQYNDRSISAESYVAETMDDLKARIHQISRTFSKADVRKLLKQKLDEEAIDALAELYWKDPRTPELSKLSADSRLTPDELELHWQRKLSAISSLVTKSGVGRKTSEEVVKCISHCLETLSSEEPLVFHPEAAARVMSTANAILGDRFSITSDQVENAIKPLKYEIEVDDKEWEVGRANSIALLQRELKMADDYLRRLRDQIGQRTLRGAMEYRGELAEKERRRRERRRQAKAANIEYAYDEDDKDPSKPYYSEIVLEAARLAMETTAMQDIVRLRLLALKSRRCKAGPDQRAFCPEAFLNVVADKLTHTAVQFINIELLVEFFYQFPREIDTRMTYDLDRAEIIKFARQNPAINKHLTLQERKEKLELVAEKLDTLVKLQRDKAQKDPLRRNRRERGERGIFGIKF